MEKPRLRNEELAEIFGPRAKELGFVGEEGIDRLASLLGGRVGYALSAPTVRSYLNGYRTPPAHVAVAMCEELDLSTRRAEVADLVTAFYRRRRLQAAPNRNDDLEIVPMALDEDDIPTMPDPPSAA